METDPHARSLILKGVLVLLVIIFLVGMMVTAKSDQTSETAESNFHKSGKIEDIMTLYKNNDGRGVPCIRVDGEVFEVDHDSWLQVHLGDEVSLDYKSGGNPPKVLTIRIINQRKFQ